MFFFTNKKNAEEESVHLLHSEIKTVLRLAQFKQEVKIHFLLGYWTYELRHGSLSMEKMRCFVYSTQLKAFQYY